MSGRALSAALFVLSLLAAPAASGGIKPQCGNSKGGIVYSDAKWEWNKELEEESRRSEDPKNIPPWGRESPEAAAKRRYWDKKFAEWRKNREKEARAKFEQRQKEEWHRASYTGVREQAEKDYLEDDLFPEVTRTLKMNPLQQKAIELAKAIDWKKVEVLYKKLRETIESMRTDTGPDFMKPSKEKVLELLVVLYALATDLKTCYADYITYSQSLTGKDRELFNSYFDEAAASAVPNTFTSTAWKMAKSLAELSKEHDATEATVDTLADKFYSLRYRVFDDAFGGMQDKAKDNSKSRPKRNDGKCKCKSPQPEFNIPAAGPGWIVCKTCRNIIGLISPRSSNGIISSPDQPQYDKKSVSEFVPGYKVNK